VIPKMILVPIDFSPTSEHALDYACVLAAEVGAKIQLVHAIGATVSELDAVISDSMIETLREGAQARLEKLAKTRHELAAIVKVHVVSGEPRDAILEASKRCEADLIVIGSHGRRGLSRMVLGSVAEAVVRRAECPVLVVRGLPPN